MSAEAGLKLRRTIPDLDELDAEESPHSSVRVTSTAENASASTARSPVANISATSSTSATSATPPIATTFATTPGTWKSPKDMLTPADVPAGRPRRKETNKAFSKAKKRNDRGDCTENGRYSLYVGRTPKEHAREKTKEAGKIETAFSFEGRLLITRLGTRFKEPEYTSSADEGRGHPVWFGRVDDQGRAIVYLAPKSANMDPVLDQVEAQFESMVHGRGRLTGPALEEGRDVFVQYEKLSNLNVQRIGKLKDTPWNHAIIEEVLLHDDNDIVNLAGFVDSAFQNAAAELHAEYKRTVFADATLNLGLRAYTVPHADHLNISPGSTAIHSPDTRQARWRAGLNAALCLRREYLRRGHQFPRPPQQRWEAGLARFFKWSSWGTP
ncbi:hypothetical protein K466DRAFT_568781 [Polyporus arcularius HHB13444]|uniref:Uncharacterized protein n=1 Tax=Polyporus arcularius HHB13444 TaxID=1314778 RepID=A0A5C3NXM4_9APHY|nr:hypothetical protein K466DRAFT_568781 [Polyporus arcularius HHB13444]